jgi:hypothetical protein
MEPLGEESRLMAHDEYTGTVTKAQCQDCNWQASGDDDNRVRWYSFDHAKTRRHVVDFVVTISRTYWGRRKDSPPPAPMKEKPDADSVHQQRGSG